MVGRFFTTEPPGKPSDSAKKNKLVKTSGERGWGEAPVGGEEDVQTVVSVTNKLQGCMVQPME